jgi:hypothetical protein
MRSLCVTKRILLFLLQFIAFEVLMWIGGFWDILHLEAVVNHSFWSAIPVLKFQISSGHILIANGLVFASGLLLILIAFEAIAKRLRPWASISVLAFVLAATLSLALKVGLPPAS